MKLETSEFYGSWSGAEIEAFFEESRIPLRVSFMTKSGLLIVPIWFEYRDERFLSCSPNSSLLVSSLRETPEIAFDISTNEIPYRGVRGRGVARCSKARDKVVLEKMLERYVSGTDNALAEWLLGRTSAEAIIEIELSWLTSWDFSDRMDRIEKISSRLPGAML